jgi:hypothetical protein
MKIYKKLHSFASARYYWSFHYYYFIMVTFLAGIFSAYFLVYGRWIRRLILDLESQVGLKMRLWISQQINVKLLYLISKFISWTYAHKSIVIVNFQCLDIITMYFEKECCPILDFPVAFHCTKKASTITIWKSGNPKNAKSEISLFAFSFYMQYIYVGFTNINSIYNSMYALHVKLFRLKFKISS